MKPGSDFVTRLGRNLGEAQKRLRMKFEMRLAMRRLTRRRRNSRGYILIVTLGALVLAATVMTTLARSAIDRTREARIAADELQRRWGMISCRQAVLPDAETILAFQEAQFHQPCGSHEISFPIGRFRYRLIISDEQAKANVNFILGTADRSLAEDRIRRAMPSTGSHASIRLRPANVPSLAAMPASSTQPSASRITGWGQITDASNAANLIVGPAHLLTCWGDGRINIQRAGADAISLAAPALLQADIQRLIKTRAQKMKPQGGAAVATLGSNLPGSNLAAKLSASNLPQTGDALHQILDSAGVDPARASGLTLESHCHSLWIITDDGRRVWYDLAVRDDSDPDVPMVRCFSW